MTLVPGAASAAGQTMYILQRASTAFPHGQVCGSQALHLSLWATATLTASSDSLRPTEAMDGA